MGSEQSVQGNQEGKININIRATDDSKGCIVELGGEIKQIVTEADLTAFGVSIDKLKNVAQSKSPLSYNPDFIFFKSPASVRGLRYTKATAQCNKTFKPVRFAIIRKETETISVSSRTLKNQSQVTGTYKNELSHTETNTIGTKWSRDETFTGGLKVDHKIVTPGSAEISFTSHNSEEKERSTTVTIGSESGVSVELAPGQEAVARIRLLKHVYEIEIEYEASLSGIVTVVWDFWVYKVIYFDILDLLKSAGVKNKVLFKEIIKMQYFSDGEVVLGH